jgi:hypothetical protein
MEQAPSFLDWLVTTGALAPIVAERVARVQSETSDRLAAILLKLGLLSELDLAERSARYFELPRVSVSDVPAVPTDMPELNVERELSKKSRPSESRQRLPGSEQSLTL